MSSAKRSLQVVESSSKRQAHRADGFNRLADLRAGADLFANAHNANRAREKGYLRSRDGTATYEEVARRTRHHARSNTRPRSRALSTR